MSGISRAAFEALATECHMDLKRFEGSYADVNTDYGWIFWQAAHGIRPEQGEAP